MSDRTFPSVSAGTRLRSLLAGEALIQAPGVFNPLLARLVERAGYPVVYVSGAGLSNAGLGLPDVGLLSMTEVVGMAGRIAASTNLPTICDADTGYGGPGMIRRAVESFIRAGVAGIHLEDQVADKKCGHLPGKRIVPVEEMQDRISTAVAAKTDPNFVLIARTDVRAAEGLDAAVDRSRAYLEAGADMIFPEALESKEEFRRFAARVQAPILANMTEFGRSPLLSARDLQEAGVRMAIYPQSCLRVMMKSAEDLLSHIRSTGSQIELLNRMQTRQELYDLLDYDGWSE